MSKVTQHNYDHRSRELCAYKRMTRSAQMNHEINSYKLEGTQTVHRSTQEDDIVKYTE